ncbi:DUF4388 domain-containing protein [Thiocystis violacea]|uniref:DUF4388 domain-containing protein n=1 Tax=Thiocystis violacea TaxID=13725 RepID=UPI0019059297|nr:DUF4388 domain-containing protein [Thiocystis violacea]MBK1722958.1 hypothetical protein [Thiocystis violacea]
MAINTENTKLSFSELTQTLRELVQAQKTGTVYLLTDAKRYARIGLKQGRIAQLVFGKYRGEDALEHIGQIQSAIYSFAEDVVSGTSELPLPPTSALIEWLQDAAYSSEAQDPVRGSPLPRRAASGVEPPHAASDERVTALPKALKGLLGTQETASLPPELEAETGSSGPSLSLFGHALHEIVNRELALYLGPIAPMVTADYRTDLLTVATFDTLDQILTEIAREIGDPTLAEQFHRGVLALATE